MYKIEVTDENRDKIREKAYALNSRNKDFSFGVSYYLFSSDNHVVDCTHSVNISNKWDVKEITEDVFYALISTESKKEDNKEVTEKEFEWAPWEQKNVNKNLRLDVTEPPCKHCKFWKPQNLFNKDSIQGRFTACVGEYMCHDFSCYGKKTEVKKDV